MSDEKIGEQLASEAERMETSKGRRQHVRSSSPPRNPSQVYSIRIPVERLDQLRRIAATKGEHPTALLRRWALERLSEETSRSSGAIDDQSPMRVISLNRQLAVSVEAAQSEFAATVRLTSARTIERMSA
jgi:hypothetical protein